MPNRSQPADFGQTGRRSTPLDGPARGPFPACVGRPGRVGPFALLLALLLLLPATAAQAQGPAIGAPFTAKQRAHWAFQPVRRSAIPAELGVEQARTPIDAFLLAKLEKRGLTFSPPARNIELIRRATFDLLGLPPTPEEIAAFAADTEPGAYERLIDRLLASPHYGESFGRFWLDLVRFAETAGYNADPVRPRAWKYRDYVIGAFNRDVPYDRFLAEQIAGDELFPDSIDAQVATGYACMWPDESNASVVALARQDALNDLTANVGSVFLGLTIGCAQCHDHKFDPIKQHDFYRLQAFFSGIVPVDEVAIGSPAQLADYRRRLDRWFAETRAPRSELHGILSAARARAGRERRKRFPPDVLTAIDKPVEERTSLDRQLVFWSERQIVVTEKDLLAQIDEPRQRRVEELRVLVQRLEAARPQPPAQADAMATTEVPGPIPSTFLLAGGSYNKPVREVRPGFLSVLDDAPEPVAPIVAPRAGVSGRRTALARWLADPHNPLVPRVIVNRIWQKHLGRGFVDNANDFGTQSPGPTHPELLDWLASEFVARGYRIKALHRLILTSRAYRQAALVRRPGEPAPVAASIDGENRLYWHANRRRLSAEEIRDSILAVSSRLNCAMLGPSVRPPLPKSYPKLDSWKVTASLRQQDRRSIYIFAKRNLPFPLLKAFDLPDMHESCARRPSTIIAPQALALLNGEFAVGAGESMAARIIGEDAAADWTARVVRAYRLAFGRPPQKSEVADALGFLRTQSGHVPPVRELIADEGSSDSDDSALRLAFADLCHALLNANEFVFVE